jgi:hypothetical protein
MGLYFSSGKNMGVFKAVGYPEDVADFYKLRIMRDIAGLHTVVIQPIPRLVGWSASFFTAGFVRCA